MSENRDNVSPGPITIAFEKLGAFQDTMIALKVGANMVVLQAKTTHLPDVMEQTNENFTLFDNARQNLLEISRRILHDKKDIQHIGVEGLQNKILKTYADLFLDLVKMSGKNNTDPKLIFKTIARSMIVTDVPKIFGNDTVGSMSGEWKDKLYKLVRVEKPDLGLLKQEMNKFSKKDPSVFTPKETVV